MVLSVQNRKAEAMIRRYRSPMKVQPGVNRLLISPFPLLNYPSGIRARVSCFAVQTLKGTSSGYAIDDKTIFRTKEGLQTPPAKYIPEREHPYSAVDRSGRAVPVIPCQDKACIYCDVRAC